MKKTFASTENSAPRRHKKSCFAFAQMTTGKSVVLMGPDGHKNFVAAARMYWRRRGKSIVSRKTKDQAEVWLCGFGERIEYTVSTSDRPRVDEKDEA